jgi:hypothetical protein
VEEERSVVSSSLYIQEKGREAIQKERRYAAKSRKQRERGVA